MSILATQICLLTKKYWQVTDWSVSISACKVTCSQGRPYHRQCQRQSQSDLSWWHTACPSTSSTPAGCPSPWTPWPGRSCSSQCLLFLPRSQGPAVVQGSHVARTFEDFKSQQTFPRTTHVMTFASPRKFWAATDESLISSFTATFCPL